VLSSSDLSRALLCGCLFLAACEGDGVPDELARQTWNDDGADAAEDAGTELDAQSDAARDAGPQSDAAAPDASSSDAAGASVMCPSSALVPTGCLDLPGRNEHIAGLCDGLDNNCNGTVDEGCPCELGSVRPCFVGPPGRAHTGACGMGVQTCEPAAEFGALGKCVGATAPSPEICDGLDNDCNGCSDDIDACVPVLKCPAAGDPRIPRGVPFGTIQLDASAFYGASDVASVHWSIEGSPCDKLFLGIPGSSASASNGQLSFVLQGENQVRASVRFTLSGTYPVNVRMTLKNGEEIGCTFPVQVAGPGLRVELCWDKTGPTAAGNPLDLDLHLARRGSTAQLSSAQDFFYDTFSPPFDPAGGGLWGHANTPNASGCLTGDPSLDLIHSLRGNCLNPRLDADNQDRTDRYVAENINLDNPRAGEQFQIAVQHTSDAAMQTRARVNVYCAGALRGSYELDPQRTAFSSVSGNREYWHVAQIAPSVDANGVMTDCSLLPLTAADAPGTPLVSLDSPAITWRE
jgi:Putative metal-binding motif